MCIHKALVIGGSGFVGSHVADALSDAGIRTTLFDRRRSVHLRRDQRMIVGDVLDPGDLGPAVRGQDAVYFFGGIAGIEASNEVPVEAIRQNVLAVAQGLEAAKAAKVRRFVFASSVYVYSEAGGVYRVTKLAAEELIEAYGHRGLPWTILRFGSLYGPRAPKGNAVRDHLVDALSSGVIEREGDGSEIREYLHVHDAARGSVEILGAQYANQRVILAGRAPLKVSDFLRLVTEILGGKIRVRYKKPTALHYGMTPYSFRPGMATRLLLPQTVDLGEGIFHYLHELHSASGKKVSVRKPRR